MMGGKIAERALEEGGKLVDRAASEIEANRNPWATRALLALVCALLGVLYWRFDSHSLRFFEVHEPVARFSALMMRPALDPNGFEKPQIEVWIREAQSGNEALVRVEATLAQHGKELKEIKELQAKIVELLEIQQRRGTTR